jgi:hypothetical protein
MESITHAALQIAGRTVQPATGGANAALRDAPDDPLCFLDSEAPKRLTAYIA